ncbi:MAG: hypothetical protein RL479_2081, partial [Verrucomicrobiota bacterium]
FERGRSIHFGGMDDHTRTAVQDLQPDGKFTRRQPAPKFSSEQFADEAIDFLRRPAGGQPFLAYVAFTAPHDPRNPPEAWRVTDPAKRPPLPRNYLPQHPFDNGELRIRDELLAPAPRKPDIVRRAWADYCGMISHHDDRLGGLLQVLRKTGAEHHTIVVYTSDHGLALGSHGLFGKQNLYEPSLRVPLILRGPGVPRGHRCPALAYGFDLFATLAELAGLPPPKDLDSRSLVPTWKPGGPPGRDALGSLYMDVQRALTTERWKLIRYRVHERERTQLFDLAADPDELADRADDAALAGVKAELEQRLDAWQREIGDRWMPLAGRGPSR